MKSRTTNITIPDEMYNQLASAKIHGQSMAAIIRFAISEYLSRQSQEYKFATRDILLSSPVTAPSADKLFPIYKHKEETI